MCLFAASLLWTGCSYDSSLGTLSCSEENSRSQGRVCRDGLWVAERDAHSVTDVRPASDAEDAFLDVAADTDTSQCPQGYELCGSQCVDLNSSPDHCGRCNSPCTGFGEHSPAQCQQAICERTCEPGWTDANRDWAGTTSTGTTDGCELACTPSEDPTEVCDGVDNNCDGAVDEGLTTRYYLDVDGDGHGMATDFQDLCAPQGDYRSTDDGDCNDDNDQIHPGADDICNGADDDCDATIDPGCSCVDGETMPCYSGSSSTKDVGLCRGGTTTCADGSWGACQNEVTPQTETCDGADNDCNGSVDDGVLTTYYADADADGYGDAASTASGCSAPTHHVENSSDCDDSRAAVHPGANEVCNDIDDNCNGTVDEGFSDKGDACTVGVGTCERSGTLVCRADGTGTVCSASPGTADASETCGDALDNTCDGFVDDGCPCNFNGHSEGVCGTATLVEVGDCERPSEYEDPENTCDGLDNDCDGDTDEGLTSTFQADADDDGYADTSDTVTACTPPSGYISPRGDGEVDCDDTDPWTHPGATEICDNKDNNCDGIQLDQDIVSADTWCGSAYGDSSLGCKDHGPSGILCCERDNDGDTDCDFETICHNGVDEDDDGDTDCADSSCDGLSCGAHKTCQSGSCQAI